MFQRETDFQTFRAIANSDVPPLGARRPDVSVDLIAVIDRCLAQRREDRFATARDVVDALAAAVPAVEAPGGSATVAAYVRSEFAAELDARRAVVDAVAGL